MNDDDPIAKGLNILPVMSIHEPKELMVIEDDSDPIATDFNKARTNYDDLIKTGRSALGDLLVVAKQSQNPRAYEVLFNSIKLLGDMNSSMLDLHGKNQELHPEEDLSNANITNNNLFIGSTKEMADILRNIKEGKLIEGNTNE